MKKKRKMKKKFKILFIILIVIFLLILAGICYIFFYTYSMPSYKSVSIDKDNKLVIKLNNIYRYRNDIYCLYKEGEDKPSEEDKWMLAKSNKCTFDLSDASYSVYIKNENDDIVEVDVKDAGKVLSLSAHKKQLYLAINEEYKIEYSFESIGNISEGIKYEISDEEVLSIEEDVINPLKAGNSEVKIIYGDKSEVINVTVTDLIVQAPKSFDFKKSYLKCDVYSKEDNDLLDKILEDKINEAGYQTRAGAVAAARFLTLNFPYRINYFNENGRVTTFNYYTKVDGEGRYYHKGLYLNSSRYENIEKSISGPKTWGCSMYSRPVKKNLSNGLDCSGFVSWALLNAGFDPGDIGAGITEFYDLTDTGKRMYLTSSVISSGKIRVGDLFYSNRGGGHIAMLVGMDKNNFYLAEAIWYEPKGVVINTYKKSNIRSKFSYVVYMDSYYKEDGKYDELWY